MQKIKNSFPHIDCPIFLEYKNTMNRLTRSIFNGKILSDKVESARELLNIVNVLSSCPKYDGRIEECFQCHFTLKLRGELARLIVEAAEDYH